MMNYFRKTRQKTITNNTLEGAENSNNSSSPAARYLLYAIGEIILVVIGILIALQINNWNEAEQLRNREIIFLENILNDLKVDKNKLEDIIKRRTDKAKSAEIMESYYDGVEIEQLSDYYFHWTNVLIWEFHSPRNIAFEELVNSGNVSIIQNIYIRSSLLEINASYDELFTIRAHLYEDYIIYLYQPFSDIIDYRSGIEVWSKPNVSIKLSEEDVKVALKNKTIKNGFTLAAFNNTDLTGKLAEILKKVDFTIEIIIQELENEEG